MAMGKCLGLPEAAMRSASVGCKPRFSFFIGTEWLGPWKGPLVVGGGVRFKLPLKH